MKTLLLLRHGKSNWKDAELPDHDRPLKKRGRTAAKQMGQLLRELNLKPDHVLTSSAVRAQDTASFVTDAAKFKGDVEIVPALYHADLRTFVAVVSHVPNRAERALIVGHNPGLEDWLARLIGRREELPTAALCQVELPIDSWRELGLDTRGELRGLWRPSKSE